MREPSVSVIIPTYNSARYIAKSIDSVLMQTLAPLEILIIDDGSTDDTRAVLSRYDDPRVRYVEAPHGGASAARNKGIDLARGTYLAFLDADDRWRPKMLERQVAVMESDLRIACCFTNFIRFVEGTGELMPEQFHFYPELSTLQVAPSSGGEALVIEGDAFVELIKFGEIPAYMQCILFRRALVGDMRLNTSLKRCQDLEFVARVFMRGKVAFTREVLTDVRRHDSNTTKDISLMSLDKLWALLPLQTAVDTPARRAALNDRLVKAWIDASRALIRVGRRREGISHFREALAVPDSGFRKLKGAARVARDLLASLGGRQQTNAGNAAARGVSAGITDRI